MALVDRLSKLDAPDREVDRDIDAFIWFGHQGSLDRKAPAYTASVDAAIALAQRLFPGTEYEFTNLYNIVRVTIEMNGKYGGFHGEHINSLPIAICIALLRAKEASKP